MKTPQQIAAETLDGFDKWDDLTVGDLEMAMSDDLNVTVHKLVINAIEADRAQRDPFTGRAPLIPEGNSQLGRYRIHHQIGL